MCNHKKMAIAGLIITFLISLIPSTALCKPPGGKTSDGGQSGGESPDSPRTRLIIVPSGLTLSVGEQSQFRVEIIDDGDVDLSEVETRWQVMGSIGEISPDGLFTASNRPARGIVRATVELDRELVAYALVNVAEGDVPPGNNRRLVVIVRPSQEQRQLMPKTLRG